MAAWHPLSRAGTIALLALVLAVSSGAEDDAMAKETVGFGELKEEWRGEVVHLSWRPRVFLYKGFLSDAECDHLMALARPRLESSDVVNDKTGELEPSETRTSTGAFLDTAQDEVVAAVEKRVAQATMAPRRHQESMQILRYVNGQKYEAHTDWFHDALNAAPEVGGQRLATALMYLSTPEEGGETVFPEAELQSPREGLSACVQKGLANKPQKGDMLLFYSLNPDGSVDERSLHESCPTLKGEKWSATIWVHTGPYRDRDTDGKPIPRDDDAPPASNCRDDNELCSEWAFFGECDKNPAYMLDGCKLSCGICMPEEDADAPVEVKPPPPLEDIKRQQQQQQQQQEQTQAQEQARAKAQLQGQGHGQDQPVVQS